jgi:hypothetical protein
MIARRGFLGRVLAVATASLLPFRGRPRAEADQAVLQSAALPPGYDDIADVECVNVSTSDGTLVEVPSGQPSFVHGSGPTYKALIPGRLARVKSESDLHMAYVDSNGQIRPTDTVALFAVVAGLRGDTLVLEQMGAITLDGEHIRLCRPIQEGIKEVTVDAVVFVAPKEGRASALRTV